MVVDLSIKKRQTSITGYLVVEIMCALSIAAFISLVVGSVMLSKVRVFENLSTKVAELHQVVRILALIEGATNLESYYAAKLAVKRRGRVARYALFRKVKENKPFALIVGVTRFRLKTFTFNSICKLLQVEFDLEGGSRHWVHYRKIGGEDCEK